MHHGRFIEHFECSSAAKWTSSKAHWFLAAKQRFGSKLALAMML